MSKVELSLEEYEKLKEKIKELEVEILSLRKDVESKKEILIKVLSPFGDKVSHDFFDGINKNSIKSEIYYKPENLSFRIVIAYDVKEGEL